jgi:hypothetical protein
MSESVRRLIVAAALALPAALATCKSSEAPNPATTIVITPSPVTLAALGRTQQLAAVVKDRSGGVMTGAVVAWSGGSTAAAVSATGVVTALANGTASVTATSGAATQNVSVTVAQVGALITQVSGNGQTGTIGQPLPQPLIVQVSDSTGHLAAGVTVSFAVTGGGGSVGTPSAPTSASGQAQTTWTLGTAAGTQTVSATVSGAPASPLPLTATGNPGAAKSVALQAGNHQKAVSGTAAAIRPAVIVQDAFNNPTPGVTVTFATTAGNGSVTGAVQFTNASGIATVGTWTLGNAGPDTLTATVSGGGITGNPVTFVDTCFASVGPPATVVPYVGNNAIGLVGWGVNVRPAVRLTDANGFPVPGATVTFAVTGGGGSGTSLVTTTNAQGIGQVGSWVLGPAAGVNSMTATVSGSGIAPVAFADTAFLAGYTITIQPYGAGLPPAAQAAFDSAVVKWQRIIYRPLSSVTVTTNIGDCFPGTPAVTATTTGLIIFASVDSIDGPGKTLAEAGPCYVRTPDGQALVGVMKFDSADIGSLIANGLLASVVLHEMGHVIGFGVLWGPPTPPIQANCLQFPSSPPSTILDTYFSCPKAQAAFDSVGGTSYTGGNIVPVENCGTSPWISPTCGAGTVNSHWREGVMTNELMTGFINTGPNPLSIVSVAAQEDLGYVVNYAAADPYLHTFTAPRAGGARAPVWLGDDVRRGPIYVVDARGTVVRVIPPR